MAIMSDKAWKRHAHPLSGWTRFLGFFVMVGALWYHDWTLLTVSVIYIAVNPILFPEAKSLDNWMSKAVLGEQKWTHQKQNRLSLFLMGVIGVPVFAGLLFSSYHNLYRPALYFFIAIIAFKLWYLNEMVKYYESTKK